MPNSDILLSLMEYSGKYNVSVSTLRRKIRSQSIPYKMDNGKYFVPDIDIKEALKKERNKKLEVKRTKKEKVRAVPTSSKMPEAKVQTTTKNDYTEVFQTANRMLDELKKAYSFILQEKETQIIQLNNEVSDLNTLVRVLEDELMKVREQK